MTTSHSFPYRLSHWQQASIFLSGPPVAGLFFSTERMTGPAPPLTATAARRCEIEKTFQDPSYRCCISTLFQSFMCSQYPPVQQVQGLCLALLSWRQFWKRDRAGCLLEGKGHVQLACLHEAGVHSHLAGCGEHGRKVLTALLFVHLQRMTTSQLRPGPSLTCRV